MKRILPIALIALILLAAPAARALNRLGDANRDGAVDLTDAALTQSFLYGTATASMLTPLALSGGDLSLGLDDLLMTGQVAGGVRTTVTAPADILSLTAPAAASYPTEIAPNPLQTFDVASASADATDVEGFDSLTFLLQDALESSLTNSDTAVSGGQASTELIALNTGAVPDAVVLRLEIDFHQPDGSLAGTDFSEVGHNIDPAVCGNDILQTGEECDDGNTLGGDGCAGDCTVECTPITCPSSPAVEQIVNRENSFEGDEVLNGWSSISNVLFNNGAAFAGTSVTQTLEATFSTQATGPENYYLWILGARLTSSTRSINFQIDGGPVLTFDGTSVPSNRIEWQEVTGGAPIALSAGSHILSVTPAQNTLVYFDGFALTTEATLDPSASYTPLASYDLDAPGNDLYSAAQPGGECCGDCIVQGALGEECDPGDNPLAYGGCTDICELKICGDGALDGPEVCDDGNTVACDGCAADCLADDNICGDGVPECGEACDDGDTDPCTATCNADCSGPAANTCGDGLVECGETCDDGDTAACSGPCNEDCTALYVATCGNGVPECGEACDDGDTDDCTTACNATCSGPNVVTCGDGVTECSETCDDGDTDDCTTACNATCSGPHTVTCGDGVPECGETCDDGDTDPCTATCNADCSGPAANICGDTLIECGEECDDGNTLDGDGCNASCLSECTPIVCPNTPAAEQIVNRDDSFDGDEVPNGWTTFTNSLFNNGSAYSTASTANTLQANFSTQAVGPENYYLWILGGRLTTGTRSIDFQIDGGAILTFDGSSVASNRIEWQEVTGGTPIALSAGSHTLNVTPTQSQTVYFDGFALTTDPAFDPNASFTPLVSYDLDAAGNDLFTPAASGSECCGDCVVQAGEECDPGDAPVAYDGCTASCELKVCGNGAQEGPEVCDDGNTADCDGCTGDCLLNETGCGDGVLCAPEVCDDGDTASCAGPCDETCSSLYMTVCGNGTIDCGEVCDDGDTSVCGGPCNETCSAPYVATCGNGSLECGETCDDGDTDPCTATCNADCSGPAANVCGDALIECGETCDDGNTDPGDGCDGSCQTECNPIVCPSNPAVEQIVNREDSFDGDEVLNGWSIFSNSLFNNGAAYSSSSDTQTLQATFSTQATGPEDYYLWVLGGRLTSGTRDIEFQIDGGAVLTYDGSSVASNRIEWQEITSGTPIALSGGSHTLSVTPAQSQTVYFDGFALTTDAAFDPGTDYTPLTTYDLDDAGNDLFTPAQAGGDCCGDCIVQEGLGEECDPGDAPVTYGGCTDTCILAECGNGILEGPEVCDDGNTDDCDGCSGDCLFVETGCGDNVVCGTEVCDDGNNLECLGPCSADCMTDVAFNCGNGNTECGEECDDGNTLDGDGCAGDCTVECSPITCFVTTEEEQLAGSEDQWDAVTPDTWALQANSAFNGNVAYTTSNPAGVLSADFTTQAVSEEFYIWVLGYRTVGIIYDRSFDVSIDSTVVGTFDDSDEPAAASPEWQLVGTITLGAGSHTIEIQALYNILTIFDGYLITTDPNIDPQASFLPLRTFNIDAASLDYFVSEGGGSGECCGDCILQPGEDCDWGDQSVPGNGCTFECKYVVCGDGVATNPEVCDDGNRDSCDGCSGDCLRGDAVCGDGFAECGEECDDGNSDAGDGCSDTCTLEICGDGIVNALTEQCDLGDGVNESDPLAGPPGLNGDGVNGVCLDVNGDPTGTSCRWDPYTLDSACPIDGECARCSADCNYVRCGNGFLEPENNEECDPPNDVTCLNEDPGSLASTCQLPTRTCNGGSLDTQDCTFTADACVAGGGTCDRNSDAGIEAISCTYPDPTPCSSTCTGGGGGCEARDICYLGTSAGQPCGLDTSVCEGGGGYCNLDGICVGGSADGVDCNQLRTTCEANGGVCLTTPVCVGGTADGQLCNECARPADPQFACQGANSFNPNKDGEAVCGNGVIQGLVGDGDRALGYTGYCSDDPTFGGPLCSVSDLSQCEFTECTDLGGTSTLACSADLDGNGDLDDSCNTSCENAGGICMNVCSVDTNSDGFVNDAFDCIETPDGNPATGFNEQCDDGGNCTFDSELAGEPCLGDTECNPFGLRDGVCRPSGGDGCNTFCLKERCGNYFLDSGEQCDPPNGITCDAECQIISPTGCGDGVVVDEGVCNFDVSISCTSTDVSNCPNDPTGCSTPACVGAEDCDDGNVVAGDGCSPLCTDETSPRCGNFVLELGETCDPPMAKFCKADCSLYNPETCGDNQAQSAGSGCNIGETCEDGNGVNGDGCNEWCQYEGCSNGVVEDVPIPQYRCSGPSTTSCTVDGGTCDPTFECVGGATPGAVCPGPDGDDASCPDDLTCSGGSTPGAACTGDADCPDLYQCVGGDFNGQVCTGPGDPFCASGAVAGTCNLTSAGTCPGVGICTRTEVLCNNPGGDGDGLPCGQAEVECIDGQGACEAVSTCQGGSEAGNDCSDDPQPCIDGGGECARIGEFCNGGAVDGEPCNTSGFALDSGRYCLPPENANVCTDDGGTCNPIEQCLGGDQNGIDCAENENLCIMDGGTCQPAKTCSGGTSDGIDCTDPADETTCINDGGACFDDGIKCFGSTSLDGTDCAEQRDACVDGGGICGDVFVCMGTASGEFDGMLCIGNSWCEGGATIPDGTDCTADPVPCTSDGGTCVSDRSCISGGGVCEGGATCNGGTEDGNDCSFSATACEDGGGSCDYVGLWTCNGGTDDGNLCSDITRCCWDDGSQFCDASLAPYDPAICALVPTVEVCDDGNLIDGDGCSSACLMECGNGFPDGQEECDDGNLVSGDGCDAQCKLELCGNGTIDEDVGEECDDGNRFNGDGCSKTCTFE